MRRFHFAHFALVSCCLAALVSGCAKSETDSSATSPESPPPAAQTEPAKPDDPAAIEALTAAGFILTKNAAGVVTESSVNSDSDISASFTHLSGIPSVEIAGFSGPGIDDNGMENLQQLKKLKRLDLSDSAIGDETLKSVAKLPGLQVLGLRRTGVTDGGLSALSSLPAIRAIDLRNSNTTDQGVKHFAGLKTLGDIQLEKSDVTDAGRGFSEGLTAQEHQPELLQFDQQQITRSPRRHSHT